MKRLYFLVWFICLSATVLLLTHTPALKIRKINVDNRGLICVAYTENGEKKALDFLTPEQFEEKFKISITNYND